MLYSRSLLVIYFIYESESPSVMSDSLRPHGLYNLQNSPGQNTGVCSLSLLQRIFPAQGLNPGFPHCRWILYQLSHKGSPRILEWVAYPFSSGSFLPRNQTGVSCIARRFFPKWALREALILYIAVCVFFSLSLPIYPSSPTHSAILLVTVTLLSTPVTPFLLCKQVHL